MSTKERTALESFIETIAFLRGPDGCPWDKEQTHSSLARFLIEETYETLEAIHLGDPARLKEELGDLLLQIVLNAQVACDQGHFDIQDIAEAINDKIVRRHPHVFGGAKAKTAQEVRLAWEDLKEEERGAEGSSALDGVTAYLPALLKALKVSEKAVSHGFEWQDQEQLWEKLTSEIGELKAEIDAEKPDKERIHLELGDVLFTLVNVARWQELNPEESLIMSIDKFKERFRKMEELAGSSLKDMPAENLKSLWQEAKTKTQAPDQKSVVRPLSASSDT